GRERVDDEDRECHPPMLARLQPSPNPISSQQLGRSRTVRGRERAHLRRKARGTPGGHCGVPHAYVSVPTCVKRANCWDAHAPSGYVSVPTCVEKPGERPVGTVVYRMRM